MVLSTSSSGYSLEANNFIDALLKISAQFQFPLGVEWVKTADTLKPVRFSRNRTTVKDIIQPVVSMYAGYDWRTEDGVVHVFQRDLVKDSGNPLNITVREFGWNHKMIFSEANGLLAQLVGQIVNPLPIGRGIGGSFPSGIGEPTFILNIRDGSARSILNRIVTVSKFKMIFSEANGLLAQLVGQIVNPLPIGRGIGRGLTI